MLSETLLQTLRNYFKEYRPKRWLFEGQWDEQYSTRSAQKIFATARQKAGISKREPFHSLRHSFATHQPEAETNEREKQNCLNIRPIKL
jgi:site-specific recombinase XerD